MSRAVATFRDLLYQLGRGIAYRSIRHPQIPIFTRWLPLTVAAIGTGIFAVLPHLPQVFGDKALLDNTLTVMATLPGFYFAGLAAVATFGNPVMDQVMPAPAPKIVIRVGGQTREDDLTRRLFLSYLFSYLVILSFLICAGLVFASATEASFHELREQVVLNLGGQNTWWWAKVTSLFLLLLPVSSLVVSTLHGIYFLTERIHQP